MRHSHFTVTSATVHARARKLLQETLPWKPYGTSVSVTDLLDLLLLMAAKAASLFAVVRWYFDFCHETAWRAVKRNLPGRDQLVQGFLNALYDTAQFSRQDRRRRWLLAIDNHYVPYYGKRIPEVVG